MLFDYVHYMQSTIQPVCFNQHIEGFSKVAR